MEETREYVGEEREEEKSVYARECGCLYECE